MTRIILYGKSACQPCKLTKGRLDAGGVRYEYVNLDNRPDVLEELGNEEWITGLPVVVTDADDNFRWCSLDPKAIREAIARWGTT